MKADDPRLNPQNLDMRELLDTSNIPGMDGLDDEPVEVAEPIVLPVITSDVTKQAEDFKADYEFTRQSLYNRATIGMELLKDAAAAARNTDNPKFIQAVVSLMGELNQLDSSLLGLHNNTIKIKSAVVPTQTVPQQQQLGSTEVIEGTVMTSADLMDDDND